MSQTMGSWPLPRLHRILVWLATFMVNLPVVPIWLVSSPDTQPLLLLSPEGIHTLQALCQDACEMRWNTQMPALSTGHPGSGLSGTFHSLQNDEGKLKSARQRLCSPTSKVAFRMSIVILCAHLAAERMGWSRESRAGGEPRLCSDPSLTRWIQTPAESKSHPWQCLVTGPRQDAYILGGTFSLPLRVSRRLVLEKCGWELRAPSLWSWVNPGVLASQSQEIPGL